MRSLHTATEQRPLTATRESPHAARKTQHSPKLDFKKVIINTQRCRAGSMLGKQINDVQTNLVNSPGKDNKETKGICREGNRAEGARALAKMD